MAQSGFKKILTIKKYVDNVATDFTKTNVIGTEDYFAPQFDLGDCSSSDPRATTTTTSTTTSTTTTTSAQQAVGDIAAIALCTDKVTDPSSETLRRLVSKILYVKVKESDATMYTLVNSGSGSDVLRRNKMVIDNSTLKNLYLLKKNISGYVYADTEGVIREDSVLSISSSITPTDQSAVGNYLVSAISLLAPGEFEEDFQKYHPKHAPYLNLTWDASEGRLKFKIYYVELYSTGFFDVSDILGGDTGTNDSIFGSDNGIGQLY